MQQFTLCSSTGVRVQLDTQAGQLRFSYKDISACAADTLAGSPLFSTAAGWSAQEGEGLSAATFTVTGEQGFSACYTLYLSHSAPLAAVRTAFTLASDRQPISWMQLKTEGFSQVSCANPAWSAPLCELGRSLSFAGGLALSGEAGTLAVYGREVLIDPINGVIKPDAAMRDTGIAVFSPARTAVICFGGPYEEAEGLLSRAGAFYETILAMAPAHPKAPAGEDRIFTSGGLSMTVRALPDGMALTAVNGVQAALPLLRLTLRDLGTGEEFRADSFSGWRETAITPTASGARFSLAGLKGWDELAAELILRFPSPGRAQWQIDIINGEQGLSVLEASYPPLPFGCPEALSCLLPQHSGRLVKDILRHPFVQGALYPNGYYGWAMAAFAVYGPQGDENNGLYFGLHDPDGAVKHITVAIDPETHMGLFYAVCPAIGFGVGGNAFQLPGCCVWQGYTGDWYDAAILYRDFVYQHAAWLPEIGPNGREDTPQWAKELSFWAMDWMPNTNPLADPIPVSVRPAGAEFPADYWLREALKLREALGVPIGYHVYNWHWIPFNNDFPHYFPVKDGFREGVKELEAHDIHVMPYINARLWDTLDKQDKDWQFTKNAKAWAAKLEDGSIPTEHYNSHEPDGSFCQLAPMCPSSGVWKKKMSETLFALFRDYGTSAVYMDQIAAAPPILCMDRGHHHLPGGGSWWTEQYNLMLRRCGQIKGREGALTTEANSEVYVQSIDGLLTWVWLVDDLVPMFPLIYAGYAMMLGRNCNGLKKHDLSFFKFQVGQQLLFGQQIGWLNLDIAEDPQRLPFLRKLVQMRSRYAAFFYKGELLRPVEVASSAPHIWTTPYFRETKLFEITPVSAAVWRLWDKTRTVLFLVNAGEEAASFTLAIANCSGARLIEGEGQITGIKPMGSSLQVFGNIAASEAVVLELQE